MFWIEARDMHMNGRGKLSGRDPYDRLTEPAPPGDAAADLGEMLASMSHFAHVSDLHNSSVMLAAASQVVSQECRLLTGEAPKPRPEAEIEWPYPFGPDGSWKGASG